MGAWLSKRKAADRTCWSGRRDGNSTKGKMAAAKGLRLPGEVPEEAEGLNLKIGNWCERFSASQRIYTSTPDAKGDSGFCESRRISHNDGVG